MGLVIATESSFAAPYSLAFDTKRAFSSEIMKWIGICKSAVSSGVCRANFKSLYILYVPGNLDSKSLFQQRFSIYLIVVCVPETHVWEHNSVNSRKLGKIVEEKNACPLMLHNQITIISSSLEFRPLFFKLDLAEYCYINAPCLLVRYKLATYQPWQNKILCLWIFTGA